MSQGSLSRRILREAWWPMLLLALAMAVALGSSPGAYGAAPPAPRRKDVKPMLEFSAGLSVLPTTGFSSSGFAGGPFQPISQTYRLQNTTASPLDWSMFKTSSWLDVTQPNNWQQLTAAAAWSPRSGAAVASFAGKLWLIGGVGSEVWSSSDGAAWTRATAAALPDSRSWQGAGAAVFNNALWVSGGSWTQIGCPIYKSTTGAAWTLASTPELMAMRAYHGMAAFNGRLWIMGGVFSQALPDVWASPNGIDWELVTPAAPWGARFNFATAVFAGKLWLLGGTTGGGRKNDVWVSSDGITWSQVTAAAPWTPRAGHKAVVHDGKLWLLGGYDGAYRNDVWFTRDGVTWTQVTPAAAWSGRFGHAASSFADKLLVMGGDNGGALNDVYADETAAQIGTLAPGATALVEAEVNASASALDPGRYVGSITFHNVTQDTTEIRTTILRVLVRPPTLTINNIRVLEGNAGTRNATFTVRISAPAASVVSVDYVTSNGTATSPADYLARMGVVTIPAGATSAALSIPVVGDTRLEPDETFFVKLSNPVGVLLGNTFGQATILNDEAVPNPLYVDDNAVGNPIQNGTLAHPLGSVQEAIEIARPGYTIIILPGTYRENLNFNGKNLTVRSTNPASAAVVAATIIDGGGNGPVATFRGTETAACQLAGLTLTGGYAPFGGGIQANGARATLQFNRIVRNRAIAYGAGVYRCQGSILNNTIRRNDARALAPDVPVAGGGLYGCNGLIRGNTVTSNTIVSTSEVEIIVPEFGGGLAFCNGDVVSNEISDNSSGVPGSFLRGFGGGLHGCQGLIIGNRIVNNDTSGYGGGLSECHNVIFLNLIANNFGEWAGGGLDSCDALIVGNTIDGNISAEVGGGLANCNAHIDGNMIRNNHANVDVGGGLFNCPGVIENNVIAGNESYLGGSGLYECDGMIVNNTIANNHGQDGGAVNFCTGIIGNDILWGNFNDHGPAQIGGGSLPTYCIIQGWTGGGIGNSAADPRFVNPASNFHLRPTSPAIDSGGNALVPRDFDDLNHNGNTSEPEPYDVEGNPRIVDGNGDGRAVVDKGAYEFQP